MPFCQRKIIKGFIIETSNNPSIEGVDGKVYKGWLKKSLRASHSKSLTSVALGDSVEFILQDDLAQIQKIYKPSTILCRESVKNSNLSKILATNLDQVIVVISAGYPETPNGLIDRMIVSALSGQLSVVLCFNKMDEQTTYGADLLKMYEKLPYPILKISAKKNFNLNEFRMILNGKKSILLGSSGVGKSTIIKSITGHSPLTDELNFVSNKGKHTTTTSCLYKLSDDTYLADIPGIKQLGFVDIKKVDFYFPEIYQSSLKCKYSNCLHTTEEDCQVKVDLAENKIDRRRFDSYQKFLKEVKKF